jgi:hypothetical protein
MRRFASLLLKAIIIALVVYGVTDAFLHPGVFPLRYFTIQSNILAGCVTAYFLTGELRGHLGRSRLDAYLRGATLLAISVTGIVYHVLLAPAGGMTLESHVLHTFVPLGFVADWLLFDPKGTFRLKDVLVWVAYPLAYVVVTLAVARFDGFYPYFFTNVSEIGYGGVAAYTLVLLAAFSALGAAFVGIDRLLAGRAGKESAAMVAERSQLTEE